MFNFEFAVTTMQDILLHGLPISFQILLLTVVISLPLGFLVGLVRFKRVPVASQILSVLVSFFRGTPMIVLIFLIYNAFPDFVNNFVQNMGWDIDVCELLLGNIVLYAVFICCTFTISTLSEVFRSALTAVNPNQLEAAHSVGLSTLQAYLHIIIPQALVSAIPNIANDVVGLFKGTSLIFYMGVQDIMGVAKSNAGTAYAYVEAYVDVLVIYVVICFVMQKLFDLLEKRLNVYGRR